MQSAQHCVSEGPSLVREEGSVQHQIFPALCCWQEEDLAVVTSSQILSRWRPCAGALSGELQIQSPHGPLNVGGSGR